MVSLAFSMKGLDDRILEETFEPPRITTKGRSGWASSSTEYLSSFSIRRPIAACGTNLATSGGGGMGTVSGAEGVVDVDVTEFRQFLASCRVLCFSA